MQLVRLVNFGKTHSGLATVGYSIVDATGSIATPRTTAGVYELTASSGMYGAFITLSASFNGSIVWDSGITGSSLQFACEQLNTNEPASATSIVDASSVVSGVWNANASTFNAAGTTGNYHNLLPIISSSVAFTEAVEAGSWVVSSSQMVFYASGSGAELARFNLQDELGVAINAADANPFRRIRV